MESPCPWPAGVLCEGGEIAEREKTPFYLPHRCEVKFVLFFSRQAGIYLYIRVWLGISRQNAAVTRRCTSSLLLQLSLCYSFSRKQIIIKKVITLI